jgi:hypothetical protein
MRDPEALTGMRASTDFEDSGRVIGVSAVVPTLEALANNLGATSSCENVQLFKCRQLPYRLINSEYLAETLIGVPSGTMDMALSRLECSRAVYCETLLEAPYSSSREIETCGKNMTL